MKQFRLDYQIKGVLTTLPLWMRVEATDRETFDAMTEDELKTLVRTSTTMGKLAKSNDDVTIWK